MWKCLICLQNFQTNNWTDCKSPHRSINQQCTYENVAHQPRDREVMFTDSKIWIFRRNSRWDRFPIQILSVAKAEWIVDKLMRCQHKWTIKLLAFHHPYQPENSQTGQFEHVSISSTPQVSFFLKKRTRKNQFQTIRIVIKVCGRYIKIYSLIYKCCTNTCRLDDDDDDDE